MYHFSETKLSGLLINSVLNKDKPAVLSQFNGVEVLSPPSGTLILMTQVSVYLLPLLKVTRTTYYCNSQVSEEGHNQP